MKFRGLGRDWCDNHSGFADCLKAVIHGLETGVGSLQHQLEIFLRHGPVGRMDQLPPTADRLLHLGLGLGSLDQGIDELIDLGLDRL